MAGIEAGSAKLRHGFRGQTTGAHEVERRADLVGHSIELRRKRAAAHEIQHPAMHAIQAGIAAGREGAQ